MIFIHTVFNNVRNQRAHSASRRIPGESPVFRNQLFLIRELPVRIAAPAVVAVDLRIGNGNVKGTVFPCGRIRALIQSRRPFRSELDVDEVVDLATLTGACVVALGSAASGIMGNNQALIDKLIKCGNIGGEKLWQLPMFEEYKDSLKSDVADMRNTGSRQGGTQTAALFLQNFVKKAHWAHIDIAGTAFIEKPMGEINSKGATGAGVRTLLNFILN